MSTSLQLVALRIPAGAEVVDSDRARAAYARIIESTPAAAIMDALAEDRDFDISPFGIDDELFHDGDEDTVSTAAEIADCVAAGRARFTAIVDEYIANPWHEHRFDRRINGQMYAFFGGQSGGDEPFDGYGAVCALSLLPEVCVPWD